MTAAAHVVLRLVAVLIGSGDTHDRGLMRRVVRGRQHVETCPNGQLVGRGGYGSEHCSPRCQEAHAALTEAEDWLRGQERRAASAS